MVVIYTRGRVFLLCGFTLVHELLAAIAIFLASKPAASLVLSANCVFSYFAIAALIYWGVVVEKAGVDLACLLTREEEIAECLAAIEIFIHCVSLCLKPSQCASLVLKELTRVRLLRL